jgi:hypothetical protein
MSLSCSVVASCLLVAMRGARARAFGSLDWGAFYRPKPALSPRGVPAKTAVLSEPQESIFHLQTTQQHPHHPPPTDALFAPTTLHYVTYIKPHKNHTHTAAMDQIKQVRAPVYPAIVLCAVQASLELPCELELKPSTLTLKP